MGGWISLHRKITKNPVWQDTNYLKLWMLCLLKATHTEHEQKVGNQMVKLKPGQFVTGRTALAKEFNEGMKPSLQVKELTLFRYLNCLEVVEMLNIKKTNKYSIVTITKWEQYQQNEQQMNNKRTTDEQQMITNNNVNNVNNVNKENIYSIFEHWNKQKIKVHRELTQVRKSAINARLENHSLEELKKAISTYSQILESDKHYYSYKLSLDNFMNPKNLDRFLDENNPFEDLLKNEYKGGSHEWTTNNSKQFNPDELSL